jgi:hypothetical protein
MQVNSELLLSQPTWQQADTHVVKMFNLLKASSSSSSSLGSTALS